MDFNFGENRIYLCGENGEVTAEVAFSEISDGVVNINHTFVDESLRGQGVASKLMESLAKKLRSENIKAYPTCSYAIKWFMNNPDYADIYIDIME